MENQWPRQSCGGREGGRGHPGWDSADSAGDFGALTSLNLEGNHLEMGRSLCGFPLGEECAAVGHKR